VFFDLDICVIIFNMKRICPKILISLALSLLFFEYSFAQNSSGNQSPFKQYNSLREVEVNEVDEFKNQNSVPSNIEGDSNGAGGSALDKVKQLRDENVFNLGENKEEVKRLREENRLQLKQRILEFKDQKKAQIVERVSTQMDSLNANKAEKYLATLKRLSYILDSIESRLETVDVAVDISSVNESIANARALIKSSTDQVNLQSNKIYSLNITSEDAVKNQVSLVVKGVQSDLTDVRNSVTYARDAVRKAFEDLKNLKMPNDSAEAQ